jgi:hypothetical protein
VAIRGTEWHDFYATIMYSMWIGAYIYAQADIRFDHLISQRCMKMTLACQSIPRIAGLSKLALHAALNPF